MRSVAFALAVSVLLAGCATSEPIKAPDGNMGYFIKCGSAVIDACYKKAAELCPGGYTQVDRETSPNGIVAPVGNAFVFARGRNSMFVECKP